MKLRADSIKSFTHRRSCFRLKRALFCEGTNQHGRLSQLSIPHTPPQIGHNQEGLVKCNFGNALHTEIPYSPTLCLVLLNPVGQWLDPLSAIKGRRSRRPACFLDIS
jgi:hypothetical protein